MRVQTFTVAGEVMHCCERTFLFLKPLPIACGGRCGGNSLNLVALVRCRQVGPEFSAVTAEHLATEEIALAGDPFVSPRVTGRELRYEWRANLLKRAGSIDEVITRAGDFIPTARGLLPNHSISSRVFATC